MIVCFKLSFNHGVVGERFRVATQRVEFCGENADYHPHIVQAR